MMTELADWNNFYVMVGSAAGALIGLQFVVLTLLAQKPLGKSVADAGAAFMTPSIVHFGVTLLLSALLLAPWQTMSIPSALFSIVGLSGIAYIIIVAFRMRRQKEYPPRLEDWIFHVALPLVAYALLSWCFAVNPSGLNEMMFSVGAVVLLLLFIGIHNAWDNISYTVFFHNSERE